MVIFDAGDADLLVVPITSHSPRSNEDVQLKQWRAAGLRLPSVVRTLKLATMAKTTFIRGLGRVTEEDLRGVIAASRRVLERISIAASEGSTNA